MRLLIFGQAAAMGLCLASFLFGKDAFSIPAYPGTQASHHDIYQDQVNPPFITTFAVFKTQDGSPLPEQQVLQFYRGFYERRGWQQTAPQSSQSEPYLEFEFGLTRAAPQHSAIHLTGRLSLWVAPKDGVITAHLHQWRNSSLEDSGNRFLNKTLECLKKTSKAMGYAASDLQPQASWTEYYEDEDLVKMAELWISAPSVKRRSCIDPKGIIFVTVLAFSDPAAAAERGSREGTGLPGFGLPGFFGRPLVRSVLVRENLVIFVNSGDNKQNRAVKKFIRDLAVDF